jgi:hypothetical protein
VPIEGTQADYTAPAPPDISLRPPQLCPRDEAYIRVERHVGTRRLGTARLAGGGFAEGCMKLPDDPRDETQCPVLNPAPLLAAAGARLQAAQVKGAGGSGLGPCGDIHGDYDAWNFSVGVVAWRDAAAAIDTVAGLLAEYDVRGHVGVAIRAIPCATLE